MAKNTLTTAFYQTEEALKHPIPESGLIYFLLYWLRYKK